LSLFSYGYIYVLSRVKGERDVASEMGECLCSAEKVHYISRVSAAINSLRAVGIVWTDRGTHNVLYDEGHNESFVSVVDFQCIVLCNGEEVIDQPEMTAVFGHEAVQQRLQAVL
jgi:hypothetical protein